MKRNGRRGSLADKHDYAAQVVRDSMAESIKLMAEPGGALPLAITVAIGCFVDVCQVAAATPELIDLVNRELRPVNLRLVPS